MIPWGITCFFEERREFEKVVNIVPDYPLKYLEIRGERPFFSVDVLSREDIRFFRKIIEKIGLRITLHATFYDINLSTLNLFLRDAVLNCYQRTIEVAEEINAEIIVLHAGLVNKDAAKNENLVNLAHRSLIDNLKRLGDYAGKKNIILGLENSPPNRHLLMVAGCKEHLQILDEVDHPHVKGILDMAHAFLHGHDVQEYFRKLEPLLAEIHVHNNDGSKDQHRAMDTGVIPYEEFFLHNEIKIPAIMEIHNFDEALQSLEWIKKINAEKTVRRD